ncbi:MAG TPA: membrane protein insertion efficiency factor YidD [Rhizomicrobium sp.]
MAVAALVAPIRLYRALLSPLFPPACRFQPTCSQYAIEAIEVHGALKGAALAARRLAHCHPITWLGGRSGYDPVPPR